MNKSIEKILIMYLQLFYVLHDNSLIKSCCAFILIIFFHILPSIRCNIQNIQFMKYRSIIIEYGAKY
jgi:hypothetical protein